MVEKHPEPVARGQRIVHEVVFEPDPVLKARVRFTHKPREALPPAAVEAFDVIDVAELAPGPSSWEAQDDEQPSEVPEE